ncbi:MAG: beta-ketoacyl-ACP synthase II [Anaerolineae bacterium]|jgi:3-oxoacyl-[acyl-carrier-protein] synthase II|nr:beta-ketoacyl-ACP synthase II [Anaerolineae bacterium]MBT7073126.1 beta-ketoacyl-ACP synthase II [Anaerolineae bacterium]MBT7326648.1 beta-ketoacyl-ACP synthase II [Anaerolineae bacterium]
MRKRVVITGLGAISPVGLNVVDTWNALLAGKSGAAPITHFDTSDHKTHFAAEVKGFDADALFGRREARRMDRYSQFALAAAQQAVADAGLEINAENRGRIGALIGTGIGGVSTLLEQADLMRERDASRVSPFLIPMMLADTAPGMIAINLGVRGPNMSVVTACATGSNALGEAAEIIRRGSADAMIAGGGEAAIVKLTMAGMNSMGALSTRNDEPTKASRPFDADRDGFLMGEGAAVLILESLEHAQARGATILAEISGYGTTDDAYHISAPAEGGEGAAICMQIALDSAGLTVDDIGYINAHGTSTKLNDRGETAAIKTVFGERAYHVPVSSTKSMTGHLLGASGALEALVCTKVLNEGIIPPTINYETPDPECDLDYVPNRPREAQVQHTLSNSFGFGGHNATLIISRYEA